MDGELVKLVYAGEVLAGHEQGSVYATLADWMKLEGALRAALLAGGRVVIKRSLPAAQAPRWVQQFE
ncbi:hypothetical protein, partial [Ideonella sp.]|uniref:hypothetical protein n=1 Tax=Ideonella sp. TaxID=1929293 RepID=UPI003BB4BE6B